MNLELKNISVEINGKRILSQINFSILSGEFMSILGQSGCGKSTLLKTIAGILECSTGDIFINNVNVTKIPPHKRGVIIVFQDIRLFPHMNVIKNIEYPMKIKGIKKEERQKAAINLLDKVKLSGYENRSIKNLSGGEMQRVAIARALSAKPQILLLDEPFSGLDEDLRSDMQDLIKQIQQEYAITTIMVTHNKHEAMLMSDTIMQIDGGSMYKAVTI